MTEKNKTKKNVIKKRVTKKGGTAVKKRTVGLASRRHRVTKRRSKKRSVFLFGFLAKKWRKYNQVIRQEQSRCLRYEKYKGKYAFCYVLALLGKYFKQTIVVVIILGSIGLFYSKNTLLEISTQNYFVSSLQTSIISELVNKIGYLRNQIDIRKRCTEDKYWSPAPSNVCNYYLYKRKNNNCKRFNVSTTRFDIGTKMCCNAGKNNIYEKNKDKLTACPGADIFFKQTVTPLYDSSLVPFKNNCHLKVCEFYPAKGFHAKLNEDGSMYYDENGDISIEKDCAKTQEEGPCSKPCGGGERIRYIQMSNCLKLKVPEACNMESCAQESY